MWPLTIFLADRALFRRGDSFSGSAAPEKPYVAKGLAYFVNDFPEMLAFITRSTIEGMMNIENEMHYCNYWKEVVINTDVPFLK